MDPLTQLLLQRSLTPQPQAPTPPAPPLPVVPPAPTTHAPPEAQRFLTAQAMMAAVRNGQSPVIAQVTQPQR